MNAIPITKEGEVILKKDLKKMVNVDRPAIVEAIATARAHGDLKENAEYHAAREQQSLLEGKIAKLEYALANAQIIDVKTLPNTGKVIFGATVDVYYLDTEEEHTYTIVGDIESDIEQNKISISSPIARTLIGKEAGNITKIEVPAGVREVEILEVRLLD